MNSGTEATSTAVRLARGYTGRDRVVIFHGNFHGATDALLAAGGSGVATLGLPGTAGVPASAVAETLVVPYNVGARVGLRRGRGARRTGGRQHGRDRPGARVPRGPARRVRPGGRGARVRRGDHRLPSRFRRRTGQVRRPARPDDVRQGHRWRATGRSSRGPARADGDPVADRPGVPCRHAVGQPDRHRRRPRRARPVDGRHLHRVDGEGPTSGSRLARRLQRRRVRRPVLGRRHARRDGLRRRPPTRRFRRRQAHGHRRLRPLLPRHAPQRCRDGARRVRGDLRRRRPHRRRHRRRSPPPPTAPPPKPPKPPKPPNCLRENAPPAI